MDGELLRVEWPNEDEDEAVVTFELSGQVQRSSNYDKGQIRVVY